MAKETLQIPLVTASPGTARSLTVHRYGRLGTAPKVYIQAALHADELPGVLAAHHLIRLLDAADRRGEIQGEIVVVPMANPAGLDQVVDGVHIGNRDLRWGGDFNRNWFDLAEGLVEAVRPHLTQDPAANVLAIRAAIRARLDTISAKTALAQHRLVLARLAYDADIVLDLHCDDDALQHVYMMPQHWPQGADLVADLAAVSCLLCDESGGHCFDETFSLPFTKLHKQLGSEFPIPPACFSATIEFRGQADVYDELAEADAAGLYRFLQRRGAIAGVPDDLPALGFDALPLDATDMVEVTVPGILAYKVPLGARVEQGQLVAEIVDPFALDQSAARTPVHSLTAGLVLARRSKKLVAPGDGVMMVVGAESLAYRATRLMSE